MLPAFISHPYKKEESRYWKGEQREMEHIISLSETKEALLALLALEAKYKKALDSFPPGSGEGYEIFSGLLEEVQKRLKEVGDRKGEITANTKKQLQKKKSFESRISKAQLSGQEDESVFGDKKPFQESTTEVKGSDVLETREDSVSPKPIGQQSEQNLLPVVSEVLNVPSIKNKGFLEGFQKGATDALGCLTSPIDCAEKLMK